MYNVLPSGYEQVSLGHRTQLLRALRQFGFVEVRVKGSHHFLRHDDGRCTVVPVHRGETIGRGLLAQILRDWELTLEELQEKI